MMTEGNKRKKGRRINIAMMHQYEDTKTTLKSA